MDGGRYLALSPEQARRLLQLIHGPSVPMERLPPLTAIGHFEFGSLTYSLYDYGLVGPRQSKSHRCRKDPILTRMADVYEKEGHSKTEEVTRAILRVLEEQ